MSVAKAITDMETEAGLQEAVIALAKLRGWRVAHFRPARTEKGWRTPVEGDAGFPDLVLVRGGRLIFAELKSQRGKVTLDQHEWLDELGSVEGIEARVWRPQDWPPIEAGLR